MYPVLRPADIEAESRGPGIGYLRMQQVVPGGRQVCHGRYGPWPGR